MLRGHLVIKIIIVRKHQLPHLLKILFIEILVSLSSPCLISSSQKHSRREIFGAFRFIFVVSLLAEDKKVMTLFPLNSDLFKYIQFIVREMIFIIFFIKNIIIYGK